MTNDFEPFDLKRAEAGEPVMFRDCDKQVRFIGVLYDDKGEVNHTLFAYKDLIIPYEQKLDRDPNGQLHSSMQHAHDIVMKPKPPATKTFWACFNLYSDGRIASGTVNYKIYADQSWDYSIPFEFTLKKKHSNS